MRISEVYLKASKILIGCRMIEDNRNFSVVVANGSHTLLLFRYIILKSPESTGLSFLRRLRNTRSSTKSATVFVKKWTLLTRRIKASGRRKPTEWRNL